MKPDERIGEAVKQASIAAQTDAADDYAERIILNAVENLERAGRRVARQQRAGKQAETESGSDNESGMRVVVPDLPAEQAEQVAHFLAESGIRPEAVEIEEVDA